MISRPLQSAIILAMLMPLSVHAGNVFSEMNRLKDKSSALPSTMKLIKLSPDQQRALFFEAREAAKVFPVEDRKVLFTTQRLTGQCKKKGASQCNELFFQKEQCIYLKQRERQTCDDLKKSQIPFLSRDQAGLVLSFMWEDFRSQVTSICGKKNSKKYLKSPCKDLLLATTKYSSNTQKTSVNKK